MDGSASFAASYARWRRTRLGRITDQLEERVLLELIGEIDGVKILDVGCGDGALAVELARRGARVTGLDPDPRMLDAARTRATTEGIHLDLVEGKAEKLPFADLSFDRVVAVTVLCFAAEADRAIAEMARVLKPGGRLMIGELSKWSLWSGVRRLRGLAGSQRWNIARFRTARELRCLLQRNGLSVCGTRGAIFYPPSCLAARFMAPFDRPLGRHTTLGAAFIVTAASKSRPGSHAPPS